MKRYAIISIVITLLFSCSEPDIVTPSPKQVEWADAEIGVMFHYDMQVFQPEYNWRNFGTHPDVSTFNPTQLNTDQWIENAAKFGAKYAILVAKHCCGFSLWPTKAHEYNVSNCPWGDGKRDIVAEFIASCKKYGVKPGLYASVGANGYCWSIGTIQEGSPYTQEEYGKIVETQLTELWSNYGELFEVWFDGGVVPKEVLGCDVLEIAHRLQPDAVKFGAPEGFENRIRWVGNEEGFSPDPCWGTCDTEEKDGQFGGDPFARNWNAGEADFTLRWNSSSHYGWAWHQGEDDMIFTVDELVDKYEKSVGRNTNMLLGVVVDDRGLIPDADVARMQEFGSAIRERYGKALAETHGSGNSLVLKLDSPTKVDRIILMEDIAKGERVLKYKVEVVTENNEWQTVAEGTNIGHKRIAVFEPVTADRLRLSVEESKAKPQISRFAVFAAK